MSTTQPDDQMQPLKALFEQVKVSAQQQCEAYYIAQLNRHLMRLCRARASADSLATVIGMGATCVVEALEELFRSDYERGRFQPTDAHETWLAKLVRDLPMAQCMDVLLLVVKGRHCELATTLFYTVHHRIQNSMDLTELFHHAVTFRMVPLVDLMLPYVRANAALLNTALELAVELPCQTLMYRLLEAGATNCVLVLKYLCAAEKEDDIAVMLATRKVQPTLACFDSLFRKYKWQLLPLRDSADFARLDRIVQTLRLYQAPRPTPADNAHTYSVFQMFLDAPDEPVK